jgi:hypothetical protein
LEDLLQIARRDRLALADDANLVRETQAVQKLRKLTLNLDQLMQAGHSDEEERH